jgi:probable rRNA maturation factor
MTIIVDVQYASHEPELPDSASLHQWANIAFWQHQQWVKEVTINTEQSVTAMTDNHHKIDDNTSCHKMNVLNANSNAIGQPSQFPSPLTPDPQSLDTTQRYEAEHQPFEMTIRFFYEVEGRQLNERWRKRAGPTNVLSFPFESPPGIIVPLLGDIILCVPVVINEAEQDQIPLRAHWAHLVIHGTLHLLDHDHIDDSQAQIMESLEIKSLTHLGYPNPYETNL